MFFVDYKIRQSKRKLAQGVLLGGALAAGVCGAGELEAGLSGEQIPVYFFFGGYVSPYLLTSPVDLAPTGGVDLVFEADSFFEDMYGVTAALVLNFRESSEMLYLDVDVEVYSSLGSDWSLNIGPLEWSGGEEGVVVGFYDLDGSNAMGYSNSSSNLYLSGTAEGPEFEGSETFKLQVEHIEVPEPSTYLLLGGMCALAAMSKKKRLGKGLGPSCSSWNVNLKSLE